MTLEMQIKFLQRNNGTKHILRYQLLLNMVKLIFANKNINDLFHFLNDK